MPLLYLGTYLLTLAFRILFTFVPLLGLIFRLPLQAPSQLYAGELEMHTLIAFDAFNRPR